MIGVRKLIAFILTLMAFTGLLVVGDFDPVNLGTGLVFIAGSFFVSNTIEHVGKIKEENKT